MKEVDGTISISIMVECPYCENVMDLMDLTHLNDDGYIYNQLLSDDGFGKEDWNETIECDECKKEFIIKDVTY